MSDDYILLAMSGDDYALRTSPPMHHFWFFCWAFCCTDECVVLRAGADGDRFFRLAISFVRWQKDCAVRVYDASGVCSWVVEVCGDRFNEHFDSAFGG